MKFKRVFLIVCDSLGVGEAIDASNYGDVGASTLGHINERVGLFIPNLTKLGFLNTLNMKKIRFYLIFDSFFIFTALFFTLYALLKYNHDLTARDCFVRFHYS